MRLRRVVALSSATALLLAGCSQNNTPDPKPEPEPGHAFTVASQFVARATLASGAQQTITLTIGKPLTTAQQKAANRPALCPNMFPNKDLYFPVRLEIRNASGESAPEAQVGASIYAALDTKQLGETYALGIQDDDAKRCGVMVPLKDVTATSIIENQAALPMEVWSPNNIPTKNGDSMQAPLHIVLSGGAENTPPPRSAVFLRLSPLANAATRVNYKITDIKAMRVPDGSTAPVPGFAGVMTSGSENGAFYVPLDSTVNPCDFIGKNKPMKCGAELAAP